MYIQVSVRDYFFFLNHKPCWISFRQHLPPTLYCIFVNIPYLSAQQAIISNHPNPNHTLQQQGCPKRDSGDVREISKDQNLGRVKHRKPQVACEWSNITVSPKAQSCPQCLLPVNQRDIRQSRAAVSSCMRKTADANASLWFIMSSRSKICSWLDSCDPEHVVDITLYTFSPRC